MSQQHELYRILRRPIVTEKSLRGTEKNNQYTFEVSVDASKQEIRAAVEKLFGVEVISVQTRNRLGKVRRLGRFEGRRSASKQAVVRLKEGQSLAILEQ
ncbi:MAG: 50S ribosomal protein L23 [Alphaproteobacteria bacterium CG_4_10_14_0_2_um_filter_63_37]|nr:MAG: 50S ribosomal protein L23 [Proteobacteria bacterium CG1_02_64_396]PJA25554.1 MAG: 50S ribosomal protein L23 [Alphaproteobacteria bacterium CG_4_10_14_0_2_um_filter_63_37]